MEYVHKEAFCLMWYACPCGHRERLWNSRDGVTPFGGLFCSSCGSTFTVTRMSVLNTPISYAPGMSHVDFHLDERSFEKPHKGQQIFRDGTPDEAVAIMEKRLARMAEAGSSVPDDVRKRLIDAARNGLDEWKPGWPTVERVKE